MFNLFGKPASNQQNSNQQTQAQQKPQGPAGNQPGQPNASNSQQQGDQNIQSSEFPQNPLDAYAAMYDNMSKLTPEAAPSFALDTGVLDKVSSGLKFSDGLDQNLIKQAMAGDEQAFLSVIEHVGRNAYKTSLQHSGALTEKFVGSRSEFDKKNLSSSVKSELVNSNFTVPNASHPVVKQELRRLADMMHKQNPDASPAEIAKAAQEYFINLSQAMAPAAPASKEAEGEIDWDKHFGAS